MSESQNTLVYAFDQHNPCIAAYDIHEWIYDTMCLREDEVAVIQIDGPRRHVYIKFRDATRMQELLTSNKGREIPSTNGEISKVRIEAVGLGMRVRIANLLPRMSDRALRVAMGKYGEVRNIQEENWSRAYRYPVANGIRIAMLTLAQHIPSHIVVAGHRTLISYEAQATTCYLYQVCPHGRRAKESQKPTTTSWADGGKGVAAAPYQHGGYGSGDGNGGTSGPRASNCRGPQQCTPEGGASRAGEGYDQTPEAMQNIALNGEDTSNVTHTTTLQELAVHDNMDGEG